MSARLVKTLKHKQHLNMYFGVEAVWNKADFECLILKKVTYKFLYLHDHGNGYS